MSPIDVAGLVLVFLADVVVGIWLEKRGDA
jgi:hypothetical protein